ncbi:MAG: hypothetical protein AB7O68_22515, partial [Pirellulales bacterium]
PATAQPERCLPIGPWLVLHHKGKKDSPETKPRAKNGRTGRLRFIAIFPYLGDFAKLGKLPKKITLIQRIAELSSESARFAEKARPHLEKLAKALDDVRPNSFRNRYGRSAKH